jgi:hypothetical protein
MGNIKLLITSTYKEDGTYNNEKPVLEECMIQNLPQRLLELSRKANKGNENELVISFPNDNAETMLVEIYNGFRE